MIMLDTNHCLSFEPSPLGSPPMGEGEEKLELGMEYDKQAYHNLKEVLQLKLQQRRTREELVSQGIMPPLKSPAAFHEQRRSLERARTEDYLKRKIRSRPERSELVRMHILEETSAEPSLQAKQLQLKRARLADDLNDKISHRPGPIELVHKNILPVPVSCLLDSPKGAGGESSSLDEDSSDALSPDQLANHDSPLGSVSQVSPSDMLTQNGDMSPTQFLSQPPPPPPPPLLLNGTDTFLQQKMTSGAVTPVASRPSVGQSKSHSKSSSDRPPQRPKKAKDTKPKVKKLKYHQYIPPDQKAEREPPPQLDSSYAKILQQQQLFLQLQIINQQQQHYNYHTILPAPPKPPADQPPASNPGPSPSRSVPTTTTASSNQSAANRQSQAPVGGAKPGTLPANLDELKVAELKQELKLRGLTVSGTKNDLIERLRNYQELQASSASPAGPKACQLQSTTHPALTSQSGTTALTHQSAEPTTKVAAFSLAQNVTPGRIMRFGSTSSSPPVSPSPSERSLAGMSPDETSCNGDMFGEMVSSPLTQLTLHPSPQHPGPPSLPLTPKVKEENLGHLQTSCSFSRAPTLGGPKAQPAAPGHEPSAGQAMDTSSLDKDQMLQEKDKQIEELTRMLRQKQRLVETLRSQLEQGKMGGGAGEIEVGESSVVGMGQSIEAQAKVTPPKPSTTPLQPPAQTNGVMVRVKKEAETEEGMEGVLDECQIKRQTQPTQCSNQTLLKLQQIHRLQVQQQQQHQQHVEQQKDTKLLLKQQQQKTEAQILLQQQQQLQQLIIQQTQQKQLQAQQKLAQAQFQTQAKAQAQAQQAKAQTQAQVQGKPAQTQLQLQSIQNHQTKTSVQVKQVQVKPGQVQTQSQKQSQAQQRRQLKTQRHQQKQQTVTTQQVTPVFISQQNGTQVSAQTISLDLLKSQTAPTLVTDGNGNHYLIALTNHSADSQNGVSSLGKTNGRITLQRLQSTSSKLPSQSPPQTPSTDPQSAQPKSLSQPIKKAQKAGLQLETDVVAEPGQTVSAPPNLPPFFDDASDSDSQSTMPTSVKREEVCPPYDRHTLFTPPSPKPPSSLSIQRPKENGLSCQQMDDLFDILLKSGEISGFKANPDPSLAHLHSTPPSPSPPPSPLHLSPPTPPEPTMPSQHVSCPGSGHLEDFLESTTGTPLLGVEPHGGLTLIDDLHSQMLNSSSILDHSPSPMDTSDLGFSPHPAGGLDFGDPTLDSMDWLDISMGGGGGGGGGDGAGTSLAPLGPHTPPSVFSADFLDSTDLQLHWDSCL